MIPSGAKIAMGLGVAQPPALLHALAQRAEANAISGVEIYYLLSTAHAGQTVLRYELRDRIRPMSLFHGTVERALDIRAQADGLPPVDIVPTAFSHAPRLLSELVGVDTLLTTVSPMDGDGNFSLGTSTDYALAVSNTAKRVILEVNARMPRVHGNCSIPIHAVTALVENTQDLLEVPRVRRGGADEVIGAIIAGLAQDGDCLQMGIGAVPDAVCAALHQHRALGIHTELMTPGLAELMRAGIVDNSRKTIHTGRSVFTFALGDKTLYDFIDNNPLLEAHPVDYVNDPGIIAQNAQMLSVNATLEIDLQGACNSECIGAQQYSGAGGQLDFVRGASRAPGGRSIIACHATAARGSVSRIVPALHGAVTTGRNDVQIVVTEYGWVNLRGLSLAQRAKALIGLAHPAFRDDLERSIHAAHAPATVTC